MINNVKLGYVLAFYTETVIQRFLEGNLTRRVPAGYHNQVGTFETLLPIAEWSPHITVCYDPALEGRLRELGVFDKIEQLTTKENITLHPELSRQFKGRWRLLTEMARKWPNDYLFAIEDDFLINKLNYNPAELEAMIKSNLYEFISLNRSYGFKDTEAPEKHKTYPISGGRGFRDGFIIQARYVDLMFELSLHLFFEKYAKGEFRYYNINFSDDALWLEVIRTNPDTFRSTVYEGTIPFIHCEFYSKSARSSTAREYATDDDIPHLEKFLQEMVIEGYELHVSGLYNHYIKGEQ